MGRAVAKALAADGLRVIGLDLKPARDCMACDISDPVAEPEFMEAAAIGVVGSEGPYE